MELGHQKSSGMKSWIHIYIKYRDHTCIHMGSFGIVIKTSRCKICICEMLQLQKGRGGHVKMVGEVGAVMAIKCPRL